MLTFSLDPISYWNIIPNIMVYEGGAVEQMAAEVTEVRKDVFFF